MRKTNKSPTRKSLPDIRRRRSPSAKDLPSRPSPEPRPHDVAVFHAILRRHLRSFCEKVFATTCPSQTYVPNWHIDLIADRLEQCQSGQIKRLIITMPPRYLKSIIGSVAFPAFLLGHDPTARIVCASYAQDLAEKH